MPAYFRPPVRRRHVALKNQAAYRDGGGAFRLTETVTRPNSPGHYRLDPAPHTLPAEPVSDDVSNLRRRFALCSGVSAALVLLVVRGVA